MRASLKWERYIEETGEQAEKAIFEDMKEASEDDKCECGEKIEKSYVRGTLKCKGCSKYYKDKAFKK
jgi:hypothetical protein